MTTLNIESIEQDKVKFGIKTTVISNGNKYSFFDTKKDGNKTKAQQQFDKFGFKIGDRVDAEVKEEDKNFTNAEGKDINYTQRTILFFKEVENTPVGTGKSVEERLKRLELNVFGDEQDDAPEPDQETPEELPEIDLDDEKEINIDDISFS